MLSTKDNHFRVFVPVAYLLVITIITVISILFPQTNKCENADFIGQTIQFEICPHSVTFMLVTFTSVIGLLPAYLLMLIITDGYGLVQTILGVPAEFRTYPQLEALFFVVTIFISTLGYVYIGKLIDGKK